jgi:hypothetical protein
VRYDFPMSLAGRFGYIDVIYERHTGVSFRRGVILSVLDLVGLTVAFTKRMIEPPPFMASFVGTTVPHVSTPRS